MIKKDIFEFYLYPQAELSNEEKEKVVSFMVVGESGSGKTTLINSFLNYLLGIQIEDNFRYKLIHEVPKTNCNEPQTSDINIFKIKGTDVYPPIQIIDTPGLFLDKGFKQNIHLADIIGKTFKEKINDINAVCFVIQSSFSRLTVKNFSLFLIKNHSKK